MAYAAVSKTAVLTNMWVRLPLQAFILLLLIPHISLPPLFYNNRIHLL